MVYQKYILHCIKVYLDLSLVHACRKNRAFSLSGVCKLVLHKPMHVANIRLLLQTILGFYLTSYVSVGLALNRDIRLYSKSSLTLSLNECSFILSFPLMSLPFLNSYMESSRILRNDTNPPAIQKLA